MSPAAGKTTKWAVPLYKRSQVAKAGEVLAKGTPGTPEFAAAREVMNNWRASHAFPLNTFQMTLRSNAGRADKTSNVVQRMKRSESIIEKLQRGSRTSLERMQDLGGCRAIMRDVDRVNSLFTTYQTTLMKKMRHIPKKTYNYINEPKSDGYRGIHLVYEFQSLQRPEYNGLKIEVQIRSRVQHSWATAVEVADRGTRQALKTGKGSPEWRRFFALMSHVFAELEGTNPVPGVPEGRNDLVEEMVELNRQQRILQTLQGYQEIFEATAVIESGNWLQLDRPGPVARRRIKEMPFYLMRQDLATRQIQIDAFPFYAEEEARAALESLERQLGEDATTMVVLVAAADEYALRQAYPNYFSDVSFFLEQASKTLPPGEFSYRPNQ